MTTDADPSTTPSPGKRRTALLDFVTEVLPENPINHANPEARRGNHPFAFTSGLIPNQHSTSIPHQFERSEDQSTVLVAFIVHHVPGLSSPLPPCLTSPSQWAKCTLRVTTFLMAVYLNEQSSYAQQQNSLSGPNAETSIIYEDLSDGVFDPPEAAMMTRSIVKNFDVFERMESPFVLTTHTPDELNRKGKRLALKAGKEALRDFFQELELVKELKSNFEDIHEDYLKVGTHVGPREKKGNGKRDEGMDIEAGLRIRSSPYFYVNFGDRVQARAEMDEVSLTYNADFDYKKGEISFGVISETDEIDKPYAFLKISRNFGRYGEFAMKAKAGEQEQQLELVFSMDI